MESVPFVVYDEKYVFLLAEIGKGIIKSQLDNMGSSSQLYGQLEKGETMMGKWMTMMGLHDDCVKINKYVLYLN